MQESAENFKTQNQVDIFEIFQKVWECRNTIFQWMGIFLILSIIIVIGSPKEYKSEMTLLVETGSGTSGISGLLQQYGGLAGLNLAGSTGDNALTPELYPDIIKSTPFLLEIMDKKVVESKHDSVLKVSDYILRHTKRGIGSIIMSYTIGLPYKIIGLIKSDKKTNINIHNNVVRPLKLSAEQYGIAGELSKRIKAKQGESSSTLNISVEMQDPIVAAQIVDSVVSSLTRYIIEYRIEKAKTDLKFVEDRHSEAEERYRSAQRNLAGYKDKNKNVILASVLTSEQNLQAEFNLSFNIYNTLSQQLEQAKMKVQEKTPIFKIMEPAKIPLQNFKPNKNLIVVAMTFLGGFLGILIIIFKIILKNKS